MHTPGVVPAAHTPTGSSQNSSAMQPVLRVQVLPAHAPVPACETPASWRWQSLAYVTPSQPHTGLDWGAQLDGRVVHRPLAFGVVQLPGGRSQ